LRNSKGSVADGHRLELRRDTYVMHRP
jgi:hypothetical protein